MLTRARVRGQRAMKRSATRPLPCQKDTTVMDPLFVLTGREVPEPADRRFQTRRMPLWNAWDCFITENLVLPVIICMIASTLFWSNSMDTFNGLIVLRIHF